VGEMGRGIYLSPQKTILHPSIPQALVSPRSTLLKQRSGSVIRLLTNDLLSLLLLPRQKRAQPPRHLLPHHQPRPQHRLPIPHNPLLTNLLPLPPKNPPHILPRLIPLPHRKKNYRFPILDDFPRWFLQFVERESAVERGESGVCDGVGAGNVGGDVGVGGAEVGEDGGGGLGVEEGAEVEGFGAVGVGFEG
jgi:hypothetical protein